MTAEEKIECLEKKLKQALSWWRTAEKKFSQKCEETKANQKSIEQLKSENAALRERLEKAVELPVKLYSKVWDKNRKEFEIIGIELHGTNYYINCANKATGEIASFDGEDIGDEWFTTEELCDLHRRAFGLDKSKIESAEARLAELKGESHEQ